MSLELEGMVEVFEWSPDDEMQRDREYRDAVALNELVMPGEWVTTLFWAGELTEEFGFRLGFELAGRGLMKDPW